MGTNYGILKNNGIIQQQQQYNSMCNQGQQWTASSSSYTLPTGISGQIWQVAVEDEEDLKVFIETLKNKNLFKLVRQ